MSRSNFSRDGGKNSFASSGLATNLPPAADMGRRGGESDWKGANESSDANGARKYRPPSSSWGMATTTTYARRKPEDSTEDIDDKWSKAFSKSSYASSARDQAPPADLPVNSRVAALGSGFGDSGDRSSRSYADRGGRDRPEGGGRDFGGERGPREGGFRDRPNRDFGDRPQRDFGDRPQRDFGDRPQRDFGDRPQRDFGDRDNNRGPPRENSGRRNFGEGDGRRNFGEGDGRRFNNREDGERGGGRGGGRRDNNREWESDPRFAGKFGREMNPRFNDREKPNWDAPLPTAPKASLDAGKVAAPLGPTIFKVTAKPAKTDKKEESNTSTPTESKADKKKAEEEAKRAKQEAEALAKEAESNQISIAAAAVTDGINAGLKGTALTETVKSTVSGPLSPAGVLRGILNHLEDYSLKWYAKEEYGDVLKASLKGNNSIEEQVQLLYEVQGYCASKDFRKVEIKGTVKKLIEVLFTNLLVAEVVDVEGIIAWADDVSDNDYKGRADAIVQTTGMVATLRASLEEEESEVDSDEDFDAPQAHLK